MLQGICFSGELVLLSYQYCWRYGEICLGNEHLWHSPMLDLHPPIIPGYNSRATKHTDLQLCKLTKNLCEHILYVLYDQGMWYWASMYIYLVPKLLVTQISWTLFSLGMVCAGFPGFWEAWNLTSASNLAWHWSHARWSKKIGPSFWLRISMHFWNGDRLAQFRLPFLQGFSLVHFLVGDCLFCGVVFHGLLRQGKYCFLAICYITNHVVAML